MSKSIVLSILLSCIFIPFSAEASFDRLVIFGDSLSDTGNVKPKDANKRWSGTFTNGPNYVPHLAANLHIFPENIVNHAHGGAWSGEHPSMESTTKKAAVFPSLLTQVKGFLKEDRNHQKDLHIVYGGSNDYFGLLESDVFASLAQGVNDESSRTALAMMIGNYTAETVANISQAISYLSAAGVKSFLVGTIPDISQTPMMQLIRSQMESESEEVKASLSQLVQNLSVKHNDLLKSEIDLLHDAKDGPEIQIVDVFAKVKEMLGNPSKYGIANITDSFENTKNPSGVYFYADMVHPSSAVHYHFADEAFKAALELSHMQEHKKQAQLKLHEMGKKSNSSGNLLSSRFVSSDKTLNQSSFQQSQYLISDEMLNLHSGFHFKISAPALTQEKPELSMVPMQQHYSEFSYDFFENVEVGGFHFFSAEKSASSYKSHEIGTFLKAEYEGYFMHLRSSMAQFIFQNSTSNALFDKSKMMTYDLESKIGRKFIGGHFGFAPFVEISQQIRQEPESVYTTYMGEASKNLRKSERVSAMLGAALSYDLVQADLRWVNDLTLQYGFERHQKKERWHYHLGRWDFIYDRTSQQISPEFRLGFQSALRIKEKHSLALDLDFLSTQRQYNKNEVALKFAYQFDI